MSTVSGSATFMIFSAIMASLLSSDKSKFHEKPQFYVTSSSSHRGGGKSQKVKGYLFCPKCFRPKKGVHFNEFSEGRRACHPPWHPSSTTPELVT